MQRNVQLVLQWAPAQGTRLARAAPIEAIRTIDGLDELLVNAGFTQRTRFLIDVTFGPAGDFARRTGTTPPRSSPVPASACRRQPSSRVLPTPHEGTKLIDDFLRELGHEVLEVEGAPSSSASFPGSSFRADDSLHGSLISASRRPTISHAQLPQRFTCVRTDPQLFDYADTQPEIIDPTRPIRTLHRGNRQR